MKGEGRGNKERGKKKSSSSALHKLCRKGGKEGTYSKGNRRLILGGKISLP